MSTILNYNNILTGITLRKNNIIPLDGYQLPFWLPLIFLLSSIQVKNLQFSQCARLEQLHQHHLVLVLQEGHTTGRQGVEAKISIQDRIFLGKTSGMSLKLHS